MGHNSPIEADVNGSISFIAAMFMLNLYVRVYDGTHLQK